MFIKLDLEPEQRARYFSVLGGVAQLAWVLSILLGRMNNAHPGLNFIASMLMGFAMVGNLTYLIFISRKWREK
jgi:hypothetical protein